MNPTRVLKLLLLFLFATSTASSAQERPGHEPVPAILSTDLSLDRDPDDWFDTLLFLTLPGIEPKGIVLEHYATDEVMKHTRTFLKLLGRQNVPVAKGITKRLEQKDGNLVSGPYHDGADLILKSLRASPRKLTLIAVGALSNEAWAYHRDPVLFREKVAAVYFVGGNPFGYRDCNVVRDPVAAKIIMEADVPVMWVATCAPDQKQKLSGSQEKAIIEMKHPVADFLAGMLQKWRAFRGEAWLRKTEQLPEQGKNLWSLPAFSHAAGLEVGSLVWLPGHTHCDEKRWTWFETDPRGPDQMLVSCNPSALCHWVIRHISALVEKNR
jgi:hypothetical protein